MTLRNLLSVTLNENGGFDVHVGWVLLVAVAVAVVLYVVVRYWLLRNRRRFDIVEAQVSLGGIGSVRIRPSYEEVQIAHRAWVELSTRKAGLPFDAENDVVVDVYNSWYELFGRTRELLKEIPAHRLRSSKDTRELVRLLAEALNTGLRPHLTCWQARFRRWYLAQLQTQKAASPQEIQRQYPEYTKMTEDLKRVNEQLVEYTNVLKRISEG